MGYRISIKSFLNILYVIFIAIIIYNNVRVIVFYYINFKSILYMRIIFITTYESSFFVILILNQFYIYVLFL